jgi:uncharacterized protein YecT (DUF1311 family)
LQEQLNKLVKAYQVKLKKSDNSATWSEFSLDTFKIERLIALRINADPSTHGMNAAVSDGTLEYEKLINKYYKKLLDKLKPADKKTLIAGQKAWVAYRDSERGLIDLMPTYTDGGTIQSNIVVGHRHDLVKKRAIDLFQYLLWAIEGY